MKRSYIILVPVILAVAALYYYLTTQYAEENVVEITIYAGEIKNQTVYAYGLSRDTLTSPGPVIRVYVGDLVRIKLVNIGVLPHVLVVYDKLEASPEAEPIFQNAQVGSALMPVMPGERGFTIFRPTKAGRFYYLCTIPGHVERGMYGVFVVEERR